MNQEDKIESIKEAFNVSLKNFEVVPTKNSHKAKLIIAIVSTFLILAAATTLLIGYFKLDWFKNEIYKVDANITREVNQANFFAETKKVNTKMALTKDKYEEQTYEVNTDFMVYLKDKTQLGNNDNLYSASLVILKSKMTTKDKEYELPSFDIRDEKQRKEFEANPNGSKYPVGYFTFYENGTIEDIQFPESADEYNIKTLKELIEKVIPKLARNRTEDNSNGLKIKTRTDRKKKTLIEEEKPKQYYTFKGSKFSKSVERDFEDDKLTDIRTKSDIHLQSNPEEGTQTLGANDFYFKTESNIKAYEWGWEYYVNNGNGGGGYAMSASINPSLISIPFKQNKYGDSFKKKPLHTALTKKIRRLGQFGSISAEETFNIGKYDVLGQSVTLQYHVGVSNGNPFNEIIIVSDLGTTTIGNDGITLKGSWNEREAIFTFVFPNFPLISIDACIEGTISWEVKYTGKGTSTVLSAYLNGILTLGLEAKVGWDALVSLSGGVEGEIINASGYATIKNGSVVKHFTINAGKLVLYMDKSVLGNRERVAEKTLYKGW